ncbi:MAG TPA: hypothetical protein VLE99_04440 [Candidatus Saccharimonadales bacterium]|nr:hypothetical protein [Candidatus Saccharimonadales bacterium]
MNIGRKNYAGISTLSVTLVIVVVGLLGFGGWYMWHTSSPSQAVVKPGWRLYKSTHSTASFQYPANWKLTKNPVSTRDKLTLENATLLGPNNFTITYDLSKTYHGVVVHNASCVAPPKVTTVAPLGKQLAISYDGYNGVPNGIWLATTGKPPASYGYATGQCMVKGVDYVAMPNDQYISLAGSFAEGQDGELGRLKAADFLNRPEVQTAVSIFKSFNP